ncbi:MAG: sugar transferase, partial [Duncaniella sp.]|nr:sugar transferase [Duncaniella sp.]
VLTDYITTLVGVVIFSVLRFMFVPELNYRYNDSIAQFLSSPGVHLTMLLFPPFMLLIYYLSGIYVRVFNKSRIREFITTIISVSLGGFVFFMVVLLNDVQPRRTTNYEILLLLIGCLFVCVLAGRLILTSRYKYVQSRTLNSRRAVVITDSLDSLEDVRRSAADHGIRLKYISTLSEQIPDIPELAGVPLESLAELRNSSSFDCVIIGSITAGDTDILRMLNTLYALDVPVYMSPGLRDLIMGTVHYDSILADPLVDISRPALADSALALKRAVDILVSSIGLILVTPVIAVLGIAIKMNSSGPIIYAQERIGYHKRPFRIFKLRSMRKDAEAPGIPQLSSDSDSRVTPIGRFMRKYRLDELPNLWNVLRGEMSLVGPRPERQYYIDRILPLAPHYTLLHQVRPGLTSWGMVKYGYATDIPGMVRRLNYDMMYLRNMSLSLDLRILYFTIFTVLRGEGK